MWAWQKQVVSLLFSSASYLVVVLFHSISAETFSCRHRKDFAVVRPCSPFEIQFALHFTPNPTVFASRCQPQPAARWANMNNF